VVSLVSPTERQKQIADDKQRIASYAADINQSAVNIDRSTAYAKAAQACYQREFKQLVSARQANTINETEGRKRLAEIVSGLRESNDLIAAVTGRASEDLSNYTQAYEKDLQQVGVQREHVQMVATAGLPKTTGKQPVRKPLPRKTLAAVPKEAVATEKTIQAANAKRDEGQKVVTRGKSLINDVCSNPDMGDWAPASCAKV
jgi:hypothetical protein